MEEYEESLRLALEAGSKFDIEERTQYSETLLHKCIDNYILKRQQAFEQAQDGQALNVAVDKKMEEVINRVLERFIRDNLTN